MSDDDTGAHSPLIEPLLDRMEIARRPGEDLRDAAIRNAIDVVYAARDANLNMHSAGSAVAQAVLMLLQPAGYTAPERTRVFRKLFHVEVFLHVLPSEATDDQPFGRESTDFAGMLRESVVETVLPANANALAGEIVEILSEELT